MVGAGFQPSVPESLPAWRRTTPLPQASSVFCPPCFPTFQVRKSHLLQDVTQALPEASLSSRPTSNMARPLPPCLTRPKPSSLTGRPGWQARPNSPPHPTASPGQVLPRPTPLRGGLSSGCWAPFSGRPDAWFSSANPHLLASARLGCGFASTTETKSSWADTGPTRGHVRSFRSPLPALGDGGAVRSALCCPLCPKNSIRPRALQAGGAGPHRPRICRALGTVRTALLIQKAAKNAMKTTKI